MSLFSTQEQLTVISYGFYASCSSPLPQHAPPLSLSLRHSFQTRCGFLEYIFGLINSWCSASQLLLVLTQTATTC
ncbi:unnamed protein product [Hymenolepis diminuta]|uniref:Uncharacterized protein n=1 Tax=Hymenolepis diminuta TaxID=6216 RepID=A0A564YVW1_HYMDI|nr:unnamed protein product [Hymenolepis diminuta]